MRTWTIPDILTDAILDLIMHMWEEEGHVLCHISFDESNGAMGTIACMSNVSRLCLSWGTEEATWSFGSHGTQKSPSSVDYDQHNAQKVGANIRVEFSPTFPIAVHGDLCWKLMAGD